MAKKLPRRFWFSVKSTYYHVLQSKKKVCENITIKLILMSPLYKFRSFYPCSINKSSEQRFNPFYPLTLVQLR